MMSALWGFLPGPWWLRLLILLVLIVALAWVIWTFLYPVMGEWLLPPEDAPVLE